MSIESKFGGRLQAVAVDRARSWSPTDVDDAGRRRNMLCTSVDAAAAVADAADGEGARGVLGSRLQLLYCWLMRADSMRSVAWHRQSAQREKTKSDDRRGDANESATVAAIKPTSALAAHRQPR